VVPEIVPAEGAAVTVPVNETVCEVAPVEATVKVPLTDPVAAVFVNRT
jgi:hypothetical protein